MFQSNSPVVFSSRFPACLALLLLTAFLLSSCGSGDEAPNANTPQSKAAMAKYHAYLNENSDTLSHWAETIVAKIEEGAIQKAASRYAAARVPYGRIGPAAESIEPLNSEIDSTEVERPPDGAGLNEIEVGIFQEKDLTGLKPVAQRLLTNVHELQRRIAAEKLTAAAVMTGASKLLNGVTVRALRGEEEPNALNDLVDVAADVEGLEAALNAVKPMLIEANPELVKQLEAQFKKAYAKVGEWGIFANEPEQSRPQEPGIAFVIYRDLTPQSIREFSQPVEDLIPLFAQAQEEIDGT
jgi:iron uptake system component EfeO